MSRSPWKDFASFDQSHYDKRNIVRSESYFDLASSNGQIAITDSVPLDQSHHDSSVSLDRGYIWTWHHRVRMGKSLPLKFTNLGFEGSELSSKTQ
ncbi:hypothetical protein V6N13_125647 [Hibiscus sabdariffa]